MPTSRRRAAPSSASATPGDEGAAAAASGTRVLKKYPNRRLYDTVSSSYITLPDVKAMVLQGTAFVACPYQF